LDKKSLIRDPSNTSPFTGLESRILKELFNLLGGKNFSTQNDADMTQLSEIKDIYGLSKKETMYMGALYKYNWPAAGEEGDYDSLQEVIVPEMTLYQVEYYQDVSAWRDIFFDVWGSDEEFADMGASHDFYYDDETFTEIEVGDVDYGDYGEVYDSEIKIKDDTEDVGDSLRENRNIIKNILNEYRRKI